MCIQAAVANFAECRITEDGFESTMQTNHMSLVLLTQLLLPVIRKSALARIVFTSSTAHEMGSPIPLDVAVLNDSNVYGKGVVRYGQTKLCNIYITRELRSGLEKSRHFSHNNICVVIDYMMRPFTSTAITLASLTRQ